MSDITRLLADARGGDAAALKRVTDRLYVELGELARREMRGERPDHTLEPTALVHELYLRLLAGEGVQAFENRAHFFSAAATAIRRLLIEHARARSRQKRGGGRERVELDEQVAPLAPVAERRDERLLALHEALDQLSGFDPQKARMVELRFFAGCTVGEAAQVLGVSESTIAREWRLARAWLQGQLADVLTDEG